MIEKSKTQELGDMLVAAGFDTGWVLQGETLTVWEHDENPPLPLTKPIAEKPAKTAK